jgi:prepilin-type N-terminal cleavage/methylation domain-containing protein
VRHVYEDEAVSIPRPSGGLAASRGFALLEVLLATAMLAVGGLIVFPTMISYTSLSNDRQRGEFGHI